MQGARRATGLRLRLMAGTAMPVLLAAAASGAQAQSLPSGGQLVTGSAAIAQTSPSKLNIIQSSDRATLNWQSFSIGQGNSVNVEQPGTRSMEIEQVVGNNVSQIFGRLTSNGQIVITNPNGIYFGPTSQIDVAGLVASTAQASPAALATFQAGGALHLDQVGSANAAIVNQGRITVSGAGLAAFVAPGVRNEGVIQAKLGTVQLASGTTATLDFYGDGLVSLAVTGQTLAQAIGPDGKPLKAAVSNSGTISAAGGTVLVTANVASGIVDQAINVQGVVAARAVSQQGGEIVLDGGGNGAVVVAGSLDASGTRAGQTGGSVEVLGNAVTLASSAKVDVAGNAGGGTALIGGNFHGAAGTRTAAATTVAKGAAINADAIVSGSGGNVAIWSNEATRFAGTVTATGGAQSGNGGRVETSGAQLTIADSARVDTNAASGHAGTWLLDPNNVTIAASGGTISPTTIEANLATGNVEIDTVSAGTTGTGNITISNNVIYSSSYDLSLLAQGNIVANASIQNTQASGGGALNLVAGWDGSTGLSAGVVTISQITGNSAAYGNVITGATGTLYVNSANGAQSVALGSDSGTTTVAANNVTLQGATSGFYAQLGYNLTNANGGSATGAISVNARGTVLLAGGAASGGNAYAQIGHGGLNANAATSSGSIAITAGNLSLAGGNDSTTNYAQIGQGSADTAQSGSAASGNIAITLTGALTGTANTAGDFIGNFAQSSGGVTNSTTAVSAGSVTMTGPTAFNGTAVSVVTTAGQTYSGAVTLGADTTLEGSTVAFSSTLDGANSLTISGNASFAGAVGGSTALASLGVTGTTTLSTGAVTTTGTQTYAGAATLGANTTLTSTTAGTIGFGSTLNSSTATARSLTVSGNASFGGVVGGTHSLASLAVSGATAIDTTAITTSGTQTYTGAVTLGDNATLTTTNKLVTLGNVSGSGNTLSISAGSGGVTFNGVTLAALNLTTTGTETLDAGTYAIGSGSYAFGTVTTSGTIVLDQATTFSGAMTLGSNTTLIDSSGITFNSTVNDLTAGSESLTVSGDASFGGAVGGTRALASLGVTGTTAINGGSIHTTAGQTYSGAVTLGAATTLTDSAGGVSFLSTVDGANALTVSGAASFGGVVGGNTNLASLTVTGPAAINTTAITTTNGQTYSGATTLGAASTTLEGSTVAFSSTLDGADGLTISGNASFAGAVGGSTALASLGVTGTTTLSTGAVTTTGTQTYAGAATLGANTTLTSTTAGTIGFGSTLNSSTATARSLTVSGNASFGGVVGGTHSLASLAVSGATAIDTTAITTSGTQTYTGAVTLGDNAALTGTTVSFGSTVDGANALTVSGAASFGGVVGGNANLASLTVTGPAAINTTAITTTNGQTYSGATTLGAASTTLEGSTVAFSSTLDGADGLTISGNASFAGAVGGSTALASLGVTGTTTLSTGAVTTTGTQTYAGAATLGANTTLTSTTAGTIGFGSTLNSSTATARSLTVSGNASFGGVVGGTHSLASLGGERHDSHRHNGDHDIGDADLHRRGDAGRQCDAGRNHRQLRQHSRRCECPDGVGGGKLRRRDRRQHCPRQPAGHRHQHAHHPRDHDHRDPELFGRREVDGSDDDADGNQQPDYPGECQRIGRHAEHQLGLGRRDLQRPDAGGAEPDDDRHRDAQRRYLYDRISRCFRRRRDPGNIERRHHPRRADELQRRGDAGRGDNADRQRRRRELPQHGRRRERPDGVGGGKLRRRGRRQRQSGQPDGDRAGSNQHHRDHHDQRADL